MRILHVIPYMHPSAGGPPVVVENFVRESGRLGHSSEIISAPLFCSGDQVDLLQRLNKLAPTHFVSRFGPLAPFNKQTRQQVGASIRTADIVHVHTLWSPLNTIVRLECARHRRPYVLMPHGMLDPYSLSVKRWRKALYLRTIEHRNLFEAQRLIYTTADEARLAALQIYQPQKTVVIPLGGDASGENLVSLASAFLERFPRARGRRQLLFLGRLHFKKGLDRILTILPSIIRAFPEVLLTVVGDGAPEFESILKGAIRAQGLENGVMMTGRLDGVAKWGAYASAELFLLPSRQENFAISVAEAMHAGLPTIISQKVNTWSYVKHANAGLVLDEKQIEVDLEEGILSLLGDVRTSRLMGRRGQEFAQTNLTWARSAISLLKCYNDVLLLAGSGTT